MRDKDVRKGDLILDSAATYLIMSKLSRAMAVGLSYVSGNMARQAALNQLNVSFHYHVRT